MGGDAREAPLVELLRLVQLDQGVRRSGAGLELALAELLLGLGDLPHRHLDQPGGARRVLTQLDERFYLVIERLVDQEALDAIAAGDLTTAGQKLIDASTAKARADLFLEGHNTQPGPFPDGLGGFDAGDPVFADGFESGDVSAWSTGEPTNRRTSSDDTDSNAPEGTCTPGSTTLCLPSDGRFKAEVDWRDFSGNTGAGQVLSTDGDTGVFFLHNSSYQLTIQLLNQCSFNNHFWVFYASTTNIEYTLTVTDTQTSQTKSYFNPLGMPSPAITDTSAFATCP